MLKKYKIQGKVFTQRKPCFEYRKKAVEFLNRYEKYLKEFTKDSVSDLQNKYSELIEFIKEIDISNADNSNESILSKIKKDSNKSFQLISVINNFQSDQKTALQLFLLDSNNLKELFSLWLDDISDINFNPEGDKAIDELEKVSDAIIQDFFTKFRKPMNPLML